MKRMFFVVLCCSLLYVGEASAIITIDYNYVYNSGDGTLTTPYSNAIVDNFDSGRPGWTYSDNGTIRFGSVSGLSASPWIDITSSADSTYYYAVPTDKDVSPLSSTVDFGGATYNYLGLFWGSIDEYNQIEFLNNGTVVTNGTWKGGDLPAPSVANGAWEGASSNLYVNFYGVPDFDAVRFTSFDGYGGSSPYAFEFDNLAVIPAPGALLLGLIGLGTIRLKLRKFVS
jgi:hypothetical protein